MEYNARIEYDERRGVDADLLDALTDYHPATSRSPLGRVEVTITLPAESIRQAATTALSVAGDAHAWSGEGPVGTPPQDSDRRAGEMVGELRAGHPRRHH